MGVAYRVLTDDEAARVRGAAEGDGGADLSDLERDLVLAGVVGIIDPPRPEAAAADLGIVERGAPVLTGRDLEGMDDTALPEAVAATSVYARVAPEHKMRIVHALKAQGHTVSMTGDGVNDAPALRAADIGVAMGVDPSVEDVMARPPRKPADRVVDGAMWRGVLLVGAVMAASTLATLDLFLPGGLLETPLSTDGLATARTAAFSTLVLAQLFNTLNSRSETVSAFSHLFVNKWLWGAIGLTLVLQVAVVEAPFLQAAFSTTSLDAVHWAVVVAMASLVLWADELRKLVARARAR